MSGSASYSDRPAAGLRGGQPPGEESPDRLAASERGSGGDDLAALLRELTPGLLRLGSRYRLPPEEVEDALQETLLRYVRVRAQVADPRAWLCVAMRRECLRLAVRRKRRCEVAIDETPEVLAARTDEVATRIAVHDLQRALGAMKPRQRDLLRWTYLEGMAADELARRCGCRPSSLKRLLARARHAARQILTASASRQRSTADAETA